MATHVRNSVHSRVILHDWLWIGIGSPDVSSVFSSVTATPSLLLLLDFPQIMVIMVKMLASSLHRSSRFYLGQCIRIAGRARTTTAHQQPNGRRGISAAALTKTVREDSTIQQCPPKNKLVFGTTFTDHMLTIEWEKGHWKAPSIVPYQDLRISPAASCLHYGTLLLSHWRYFLCLLMCRFGVMFACDNRSAMF